MVTEITSDELIPIDTCFRLKAGPGAGKTYWLINHVRNVIENAFLGKQGKVACITYSNIGVETIKNRLGNLDKVEILTIHSFLYCNIVKPYFYMVAEKYGFSLDRFSGVIDDYVMNDYVTMHTVQEKTKTRHLDLNCWTGYLKGLKWSLDNGNLVCKSNRPVLISNRVYYGSNQLAQAYKSIAWENGIMHYDDVLYFSYMLVQEFPWIYRMLSVAYPFIFVDEYQDTNPIQSKIIENIGQQGAIIGIIGDVAQSIYGFIGASPKNFIDFSHPNIKDFEIRKNRRSLPPIINFLNRLRSDLKQEPIRDEIGEPVCFIVGTQDKAFIYVQETLKLDTLVLSYSNIETNSLRYKFLEKRGDVKASKIDDIEDGNSERKKIISYFIKAIEHAKLGKFKTCFNYFEHIGFDSRNSLSILKTILSDENLDSTTLTELVIKLKSWGIEIAQLAKGKAKDYYDSHTYGKLAQAVSIEDDDGKQRTIHKAKGDEYENVLVLMGEKFDPKNFLNFGLLSGGDSNRVYYVAMSRAKDRLFVNLPTLSVELEEFFNNEWGIEVVRL